jgi:hypothetical protein
MEGIVVDHARRAAPEVHDVDREAGRLSNIRVGTGPTRRHDPLVRLRLLNLGECLAGQVFPRLR